MEKRLVSVWFPYLKTEWMMRRNKSLRGPLVLYGKEKGRLVVSAVNREAADADIKRGMALVDARAVLFNLQAIEEPPDVFETLLQKIAAWFIRFSPFIVIQDPDGLLVDASGCSHLWGGEEKYLQDIFLRMKNLHYTVRLCMAGTTGTAWAVCRFGNQINIPSGLETAALEHLPPASLRIDPAVAVKLNKLGLREIGDLRRMPVAALRRRMGESCVQRLHQALGTADELLLPIQVIPAYQERMNCLVPVVTRSGIEMALQQLLEKICLRLAAENKGIRTAVLTTYNIDGKQQQTVIGTSRATSNAGYVSALFDLKLSAIEPGWGIELFVLEVPDPEDQLTGQENIWVQHRGWKDDGICALVDKISNKIGPGKIHRYTPAAHHWPERAYQPLSAVGSEPVIAWPDHKPRPLQLLDPPCLIKVTAPIPDYPPMNFQYQEKMHKIIKADGPERIEQEWWIQEGMSRDYYQVEDDNGNRYWIFRQGHYHSNHPVQWFLHGFFV